MPSQLDLPLDRPRGVWADLAADSLVFRVDAELVTGMEAVARKAGCTLFVVLLSVLQALLARYTGQERLSVATPLAGRSHADFMDTVGMFVNVLPVVAELGDRPSLVELARRTQARMAGALAHQDVPFDRVVAELAPVRTANLVPYMQVACQLVNNLAPGRIVAGAARFETMPRPAKQSPFELSLFAEHGEELWCAIAWATALFDKETIVRLRDNFVVLLAAAVRDPTAGIWRLPLLTAHERAVLVDWSFPRPAAMPGPAS